MALFTMSIASGQEDNPGGDSDPIEFRPRIMSLGLVESSFELPGGQDSAAFEDCMVDEEIRAFLDRYHPSTISRSFPTFDPHNYPEYDHLPPLDRFFKLRFDQDLNVPDVARVLDGMDGVLFAEPVYFLRAEEVVEEAKAKIERRRSRFIDKSQSRALAPNDEYFYHATLMDQWNLHDDGAGIGCPTAWTYTTGDPDVHIGNLDFGIWWDHTELDISGGLFVNSSLGGELFVDGPQHLDDPHSIHATQSAGILVAQTNNGNDIAGIARGDTGNGVGCSLYDLQLRWQDLSEENLEAWGMAVEAAVDPLGTLQCDVISMSISAHTYNEEFRGVMRFANEVGANIVCANGRRTGPGYPALLDKHWITVTGVHDSTGAVFYDSGRGFGIDMMSPGGVWSTSHPALSDPTITDTLSYYSLGSCAAPHAAGSIALLRSYLGNGLAPEDYENILKLSSMDVLSDGNPQSWDDSTGHGKLRIDQAIANADTMSILEFQTANTDTSERTHVVVKFMTGSYKGANHEARRYKVSGDISFSGVFSQKPVVWGRCEPAYPFGFHGLSDYSPNYGEPFHDVVDSSVTVSGCTAFTYVYLLKDKATGQYTIWYPAHFSQIPVAVKAMGPVDLGTKSIPSAEPHELRISPNPFNAGVSISYRVQTAGRLTVDVVDLRGRRVCRLMDGDAEPGVVDLHWAGVDDSRRGVSSGTYFLRISDGGRHVVEKLSLVK
jgi:hypothetical protein